MAERDTFSFPASMIESTSMVDSEDMENFLNSDADSVKPIVKKEEKPAAEEPASDPKDPKKEEKKEPDLSNFDILDNIKEDEEEEDPKEGNKVEVDILDPKLKKQEAPNLYNDFAKELFTVGALTPDEDEEGNEVIPEIKTPEAFLEAIQKEGKKQAEITLEKFLGHNGPEYREAFDQIFVNGVDPYEYYTRQSRIEGIEAFDISTEENQERIVRQLYRQEKRTQESIDNRITKLKSYGDLEDEAKEAKLILTGKEQQELQEVGLRKQREMQRKAQIKNEYVTSINKILSDKIKEKQFDGIPVDKKTGEQLYSYLTKEKYETPDKQTLTEFDKDILDLTRPENHSTRVKLALILQILKKDPTLSTISKRAITKESSRLFQNIEKNYGKKAATQGVKDTQTPDSDSRW